MCKKIRFNFDILVQYIYIWFHIKILCFKKSDFKNNNNNRRNSLVIKKTAHMIFNAYIYIYIYKELN